MYFVKIRSACIPIDIVDIVLYFLVPSEKYWEEMQILGGHASFCFVTDIKLTKMCKRATRLPAPSTSGDHNFGYTTNLYIL